MAKKSNYIWLILVVLLAFGLRLPLLNGSFWMDEAAQALESNRPLNQQFDIAKDFQPPLLHLLTHAATRISTNEWWLRTVGALIPGLLSVIITFVIGKKLHSEKVGLVASVLLATSSLHIFYSQELRPYTLPLLWAVLSLWLLLRWLDKPTLRDYIFLIFSNAFGLYSSYLYPFLLMAQLTWITCRFREQLGAFIVNLALTSLCFMPWLPMFFQQLEQGGVVRNQLTSWETVVSVPQLKALLLIPAKFVFGVVNVDVNVLYGTLFVAIVITSGWLLSRLWHSKKMWSNTTWFLLNWLLAPFITSWIISFVVPVVQPKRLLYLLPALYLLISYIAIAQQKKVGQKVGWFLIAGLVAINLLSTVAYYTDTRLQRENWRALHQEITKQYSPEDTIAVFAFYEPIASWIWYDQGRFPTWSNPTLSVQDTDNLSDKLKVITHYEHVLLFDYLRDLTDPQDRLGQELKAFGYTEVKQLDYPNIGFVRVYERHKPVATQK